MKVFGTLVLGNNTIQDCEQALLVEGEEVFRLRERQHDGQLVVDFDLRDENDQRLAKISKNHVVYCADDLEPRSRPGRYEVAHKDTGAVLAVVEELGPSRIRLTGTFYVKGWRVEATESGVRSGDDTISDNTIRGCRAAIVVGRSTVGIGSAKAEPEKGGR